MKRSVKIPLGFFLLIPVLLVLDLSCSDGADSGEIAVDLANRLTSALEFEGGTLKDGDPPEEHADDEAYPQIIALSAPERIEAGQAFNLLIEGSAPDPAEVAGAVVAVDQASGYLEVMADYDAETDSMLLTGVLNEDEELYENSFTIRVALLDTKGMVGKYLIWELDVAGDKDGDADWEVYCEEVCRFNIECGYMNEDGRDIGMEECKASCKEDADRVTAEHGADCMQAVEDLVSCALNLSCEEYIDSFRDEPLQCLPENAGMRQACPNVENFADIYNQ